MAPDIRHLRIPGSRARQLSLRTVAGNRSAWTHLDRLVNWQSIATFLSDADQRPLIAVDSSGVVRLFNRAAERLLGWTRDEGIGERWERLVDPAGRKVFAAALHDRGPHEVWLCSVTGDRVLGAVAFQAIASARVGIVEAHDEQSQATLTQQVLRERL